MKQVADSSMVETEPRGQCMPGQNLSTRDVVACSLLFIGTWMAFYQVLDCDFVNFDDPVYVTQNMDVQRGVFCLFKGLPIPLPIVNLDTFLWAFRETGKQGHWHPLTWLSLALDFQLHGLQPWGFHLTNLLLHAASTCLLYFVLRCSTGAVWASAAVAGFFAWHPLHVESVAWVTERKDVLSTFFWMLTMLAYVRYVRRPGWKTYAWVVLFFCLGLLAKPMGVTLPFVLLLWDYWPLGRIPMTVAEKDSSTISPGEAEPCGQCVPRQSLGTRMTFINYRFFSLLLEKIPLLILALASSGWTYWVMQKVTVRRLGEVLTLESRVVNALVAYVTYLRKMVWPVDLAAYYPVVLDYQPTREAALAALLLIGITLLALIAARRFPFLLVGWLWYAGTLLPVSLRLQAGAYILADRYTYVPLIGIFLAMIWFLKELRWPRLFGGLVVGLLLACLVLTWHQVRIWANSETLWTHTLAHTHNNFLAHINLAEALERQGRNEKAVQHYEEAIRIYPHLALGHWKLALACQKFGKPDQAMAALRKAVELAPDQIGYRQQLAHLLRQLRREEDAMAEDREIEHLWDQRKK